MKTFLTIPVFAGLLTVVVVGGSCRDDKPHFAQLSSSQTGIGFRNDVTESDSFNIFHYPYLYAGGGVCAGDVNKDGLDDLFFVANRRGGNKLYLNKGNFQFEDATARAGVAGLSDWCTGAVMVDLNADGLLDIYVNTVSIPGVLRSRNELYINKGNGRFAEEAEAYGLAFSAHGTQSAFFDYDRDGDLDCFLLNHGTKYSDDYQSIAVRSKRDSLSGGKLLRNEGPLPPPKAPPGSPSGGVSSAQPSPTGETAHNTASLQRGPRADGGLPHRGRSGWGREPRSDAQVSSPLGRREGLFVDVTASARIYSAPNEYGLGVAVADLNNDGWPDLYVGNDFKENDFCYLNNGDGTFRESATELFPHVSRFSMGNDAADYNNDGWLDLITVDMLAQDETVLKTQLADDDIEIYNYKQQNFGFHYQFSKNCLQQNVQGQRFTDVALQQGVAATDWSWAPLLADFNNDGKKDLFVSNGFRYRTNDLDFTVYVQNLMQREQAAAYKPNDFRFTKFLPHGDVPDFFYLGSGGEGFADASAPAGFTQPTLSSGAAYTDLDNDGDLDLVVNRVNGEAGIYRNGFAPQNFLQLQLQGSGANTQGIGAVVYAYAAGGMQCVHQSPVRGFLSSVSPVLQFGLGENETIDSLVICWPDGSGQRLYNVKARQRLALKQTDAAKNFSRPLLPSLLSSSWVQADSAAVPFAHREDEFDDLNVQPLLPHGLATQGPKLAVGDVNGDGREDLFIGGAKGQSGAVLLQDATGRFLPSVQPALAADSLCEDTDALFFDADGDKDLDLYVVSGGNEFYGRQPGLPDRLYTNDGRGNFSRSDALPLLYENKSCVRAADFDKDGDLDLFVGGRANARLFGYTPASVILQNEKGKFSERTDALAQGLSTVGMVTDACWTDVDRDGWTDLLVVGEWMPPMLFKNNRGKLEKAEALKNANGLWQCVLPADVDGDGDTDFLLGNWGTNTKLTATAEAPLKLFIADWDNNGETEPVLTIKKEGRYFPFFGKTDLERRLPFLRKRFLKAADFAGKDAEEIFTKAALDKAKRFDVHTTQSAWLRNDGGKLSLQALPSFLQTAPIMTITELPSANGAPSFLAAGNFYEVSPYEGRYDALLPVRFSFRNGKAMMDDCLPLSGAVRDAQTIRLPNATGLLLAQNNGPLVLYTQKQKP